VLQTDRQRGKNKCRKAKIGKSGISNNHLEKIIKKSIVGEGGESSYPYIVAPCLLVGTERLVAQ
jgi:hypothetical protein